ncbi:Cellulose synthase 1 [Marinomonas spartinae]|uniref:UDP-forming cellulose synthase catalytic subunit n=1 Tax=Marinomonas spartinae TaxID=1792290 RepID=UPI000808DAED|nr:UDP-forming cellulose synthase catalytic subunit [Marinomonas spartinae]SBS26819.1 Cellulose synthase 1 [Marinomonas spartinae]
MNKKNNDQIIFNVFRIVLFVVMFLFMAVVIVTPLDLLDQSILAISSIFFMLFLSVIKSRFVRIILIFLSVVVSTRYLYWRMTSTLLLSSPLELVLGYGLFLAEIYAWVIMLLGYMQTICPLKRKIYPLPKDSSIWPTVDIYIPTYNESLEIVQDTVLAALNISYPKDKVKIYLLDDGKRPEFGKYAASSGVGYITRSNNEHAKAGNLNNALKQTQGELICIFDCDHVATKLFLQSTVGAFIADPKLALMQTPHHFYSPDPFERNMERGSHVPSEVELFYGPVQEGNDYWNAAFFCGSCAVIKRSALEDIGGFAVETVTEDAHTALRLQRNSWNTAYLSIPLAAGLSTERLALHIGQRARWARGMSQIFRIDNPLLGRGLALYQRLCYLNAMLHFQFPLARIVFITAPLAYLLFGLNVIHASPSVLLAYALPHLIHSIKTNTLVQGKHRFSFWGEVYETVLCFALVKPTLLTLYNPKKGSFNVTEKGGILKKGFFDAKSVRPHLIVLLVLIVAIIWGVIRTVLYKYYNVEPFSLLLNVFWASFSTMIILASLSVARESKQERQSVRINIELNTVLYLNNGKTLLTKSYDLSMGGIQVDSLELSVSEAKEIDNIEVFFDGKALLFPVEYIFSNEKNIRFRFKNLPIKQRKHLVEVVMGRADAWLNRSYKKDQVITSLITVARQSVSLFSSSDRNLGWRKWCRQFLGYWKVRVFLVFLISLLSISVTSKVWASDIFYNRKLSLETAGFHTPLVLYDNGSQTGAYITLRKDEYVSKATFHLLFKYPNTVFPEGSLLQVKLNGQVVKKIPLDTFSSEGVSLSIPISPDLILSKNNLSFEILDKNSSQCIGSDKEKLRRVVISNKSNFSFISHPLSVGGDLAGLPRPFFDTNQMTGSTIPIIFPREGSSSLLESAGVIASYFGALAKQKTVRFPISENHLPDANAIALVIGNKFFGRRFPPLSGPEIRLINNPKDKHFKIMLVMGRNDKELKEAAQFFAEGKKMNGNSFYVPKVSVPMSQPYDAKNWIRIDHPTPFSEIAKPADLISKGVHHSEIDVYFRAPPDLYQWRNQSASMKVNYLFPESGFSKHDSKLDVTLNGKYLTSLRVNETGIWASLKALLGYDTRKLGSTISIPASLLYGENRLQFYFDLKQKAAVDCQNSNNMELISRILPSSTLDLTKLRYFTALPNLSYFVSSGFPFTRMADLSGTVVVLPKQPSIPELSSFLDTMAKMGASTGSPVFNLRMQQGLSFGPETRGKNVLVISRISRLENSNMLQSSPFKLVQRHLILKKRSLGQRLKLFLLGNDWKDDKAASSDLQRQNEFSGLLSFASPLGSSKTVVVMTSSNDKLMAVQQRLFSPNVSAHIHGDLSIVLSNNVHSYQIGMTYGYGELSWYKKTLWYFSQHIFLLVSILLVSVLLGALLLYPIIKRRVVKRLSEVRKETNEQ